MLNKLFLPLTFPTEKFKAFHFLFHKVKFGFKYRIEFRFGNVVGTVVKKAALIPFFNGNGDRNWRANFDFIIKPDNLQKIIEDTYGSGQENSHSFDTDKLFEHALNTVPTINFYHDQKEENQNYKVQHMRPGI